MIPIKIGSIPYGTALHVSGRLEYNERIGVRLKLKGATGKKCGLCYRVHKWEYKTSYFYVHRIAFTGCVLVGYEKNDHCFAQNA